MTPRRIFSTRSVLVETFIPSATGVVHDDGVPLRPSISTTHRRHEPNAFRRSVAQSFGMLLPSIAAARIIEVSAGTVTDFPSISTVTFSLFLLAGVPKSGSMSIVISWHLP